MLEEQFRAAISSVLATFSNQGMSLGSIYYTFKDIFKEFEQSYNQYIQQQLQTLEESQQEEKSEEIPATPLTSQDKTE